MQYKNFNFSLANFYISLPIERTASQTLNNKM